MAEEPGNKEGEFTAAYSGHQEAFSASDEFRKRSHVQSMDEYRAIYKKSVDDSDKFWGDEGRKLDWIKPFTKVKNTSFAPGAVDIKWYEDGTLNACYNCVDRHLPDRAEQTAIIFEPDNPDDPSRHITYQELYFSVCRFANILKKLGVEKGDRVTIYMPMIPEVMFAMLACARIGAIHSVIFAGFAPDSIRDRVLDCDSDFVITADEGMRGGKPVPLKKNVDAALKECPDVKTVLVVKRTGADIGWKDGRDFWYHDELESVADECDPVEMSAEDPLFILYTSGSTGKPKGVLHTTAGYLVYTSLTHKYVFDYSDGDIFWCTADVGWITGHSYMVYGPMVNGATQVFFEGVPTYPDASRFWAVVDKHNVNIFYTAPTAIRALMRLGDEPVTKYSRKSLRLLGTVGEPINPEAWMWYHDVVGDKRCPVVDTWWQTETGGIMITPLPGAIPQKPGSATFPFFGIKPEIVNKDGEVLEGACDGLLTITDSWPGQMRTVYRNHDRFEKTYFGFQEQIFSCRCVSTR